MKTLVRFSTGMTGLDEIIDFLRIGDNVVWQVADIKDYKYVVDFFVKRALEDHRKVIYIRFADHSPLLSPQDNVTTYFLDAQNGFESFSTQAYHIITQEGEQVFYVFDCLSDLLLSWANDLMIGNFFMIMCPYLFELNTIAYFSIIRNRHSFKTVARIRETTQVFIDIYHYNQKFHVHPLKVWQRYSSVMFLPSIKDGDRFIPITSSVETVRLFSDMAAANLKLSKRHLDYWDRLFLKVEDLLTSPGEAEEIQKMIDLICRIMISREPGMLELARTLFTLEDLLAIKNRLIGSGFIGGKTAGMLVARKILLTDPDMNFQHFLEPHDSFYVGADVFYSYLVQNGWWKLRMQQKTDKGYFKAGAILKKQMKDGEFPNEIKDQFWRILEYFGQSPIIVRSSSLLEDSFGNAFAGKYESLFCVNQRNPEQRYADFEDCVRRIYASTMNEDALTYRLERGLEKSDEQMALLVQRVSGTHRQDYFFPDAAGVGISYNPFAWKKDMEPEAGMLRLVLGLGTRAVNRVEGDYPRLVALDEPLRRPLAGMDDMRKFCQREVDVLNLKENAFQTLSLFKLMSDTPELQMAYMGIRDYETDRAIKKLGIKDQKAWIINFDGLLSQTPFAHVMRRMLKKLEAVYNYPVDTEFTLNFTSDGKFKLNLLQCRPFQGLGSVQEMKFPEHIPTADILLEMNGNFLGGSISRNIKQIIMVDPTGYVDLSMNQKYDIARLIGRLNRQIKDKDQCPVMLLGPGRWGTTTPSLGVPVSFSDINHMTVLGEIAYADGNLMPELSFGTHFFQDLVETRIFYIAIFPENKDVRFNSPQLSSLPNMLENKVPSQSHYGSIVKVYDVDALNLKFTADLISQHVMCYYDHS
ncbi:MAG: PEP/pyruvate-binding domain-containing protein [Desulfobacterales bacterium]|nr:PEP/pyruvate-binding domain-containing protein [Desulfobacterales bacterium]MDD4071733.1 PEP/pyruvate-binding domain-containing protein [Desulfobacterales bacterium]MDD4391695.1 PEP/pyruvate-binding domain-containing protein [Desulfobacterales bacterium]